MSRLEIRVRTIRLEKGISQAELASRAGVRQATISDLETGKTRRADFDVLERVARALSVRISDILSDEALSMTTVAQYSGAGEKEINHLTHRLAVLPKEDLDRLDKAYARLQVDCATVNELISSSRNATADAEALRSFVYDVVTREHTYRRDPRLNPEWVADLIQGLLRVFIVKRVVENNPQARRSSAWEHLSDLTWDYMGSGDVEIRDFVVLDDNSIEEVPPFLVGNRHILWPNYLMPEKKPGEPVKMFRPEDLYTRHPATGEDWGVFVRNRDPNALPDSILDAIRRRVKAGGRG